jgi:hypothetical protein
MTTAALRQTAKVLARSEQVEEYFVASPERRRTIRRNVSAQIKKTGCSQIVVIQRLTDPQSE